MKKLLLIVGLIIPAMAFSQSNDQGVIQLGLGWGIALGGSTVKSTFAADTSITGSTDTEVKGNGVGAKALYGIKFQYGFAEKISAGMYIRREAAVYTTTYDYTSDPYDPYGGGSYGSTDITTSGIALGIEGKFYVVNKDHFNLYFGPSVGYSSGKATLDYADVDGSLKGLNYSIGGGLNWYWGNTVGMFVDFGYAGQSLSGEPDDIKDFNSYDDVISEYKVTGGNVFFGLGFMAKFGGN